jgi:NADH:ubiquinone oxidoreductase subunit E
VEEELGIQSGETREDFKVSLERVACFGACALAPVMVIDDAVHGKVTAAEVRQALTPYGKESAAGE